MELSRLVYSHLIGWKVDLAGLTTLAQRNEDSMDQRNEDSIGKEENIFFSRFSCLFSPFLPFLHLFSTSLSYVVNFYKLIRHLQWGTHLSLAGEKRAKNKLMTILLM